MTDLNSNKKTMNEYEEEKESLTNILIEEFPENEIKNIPSQFTTTEEWLLHIIPIETQKSSNKDPLHNHLDPKNTKRVIHSLEAPEKTHEFVQNYLSLNLDQVIESKIGPSGFYLKYLLTATIFIAISYHQMTSTVTFAFQNPTYICTTGPKSADTFECTEHQYCQQIYHPFKTQDTFYSYTKEFDLDCDMPTRQ